MKRKRSFRLMKAYPDSPLFGTIVREDDHGWFVDDQEIIYGDEIVGYPEFWEDITDINDPMYKISITGRGTKEEIANALQEVLDSIHEHLDGELDNAEWKDDTLFTTITINDEN
jgi:hypothetical protein